jgi:hypothetical protein
MAHKGRSYPLAFRRDFNLNVDTNQIGWPIHAELDIKGCSNLFGQGVPDHRVFPKNPVASPPNTYTWTSLPWTVAPHTFTDRIWFTIDETDSTIHRYGAISVAGIGDVLRFSVSVADQRQPGWHDHLFPGDVLWYLTSFFPSFAPTLFGSFVGTPTYASFPLP